MYRRGGFLVCLILMDDEFEKVREELPDVEMNTAAAREHVTDIERGICTLKERIRCIASDLCTAGIRY